MRLSVMLVVATCLLKGQEAAKTAPPAQDAKTEAKPTERPLNDGEIWHLRDTMAELANLDAEYKISEYSAKRAALLQEQMTVITPACLSVSVPQDRISYALPTGGTGSDCGVTVPGKDKDGKPILRAGRQAR